MSDAIRDPNNRNAPKQRLYSLETRIGDMYDAMKASGLKKFGDKFHLGLTKFRELRPFYDSFMNIAGFGNLFACYRERRALRRVAIAGHRAGRVAQG